MTLQSQKLIDFTNYLYRFQEALEKNRVKKICRKHQEIINQAISGYDSRLLELYNKNNLLTGQMTDFTETQHILNDLKKQLKEIDTELNNHNSRWQSKKSNISGTFVPNRSDHVNLSELRTQVTELDNKIKNDFIWPLIGKSQYVKIENHRRQLCFCLEQIENSYKSLARHFSSLDQEIQQFVQDRMFKYYEEVLIRQEDRLKTKLKKMKKVYGTFFEPIPQKNQMRIGADWNGELIFQLGYESCENYFLINNKTKTLLTSEVPHIIDLSKIDYLSIPNEQDVKSLVLRMLNTLPAGSIKLNVYDPRGKGDKIDYLFKLGSEMDKLFLDGQIKRTSRELDELLEYEQKHITEINAKFLSGKYQNLVERNKDVQMGIEPYHLVILFESPNHFDKYGDDKQMEFNSLIKNAGKYGVFVIVCSGKGSLYDGARLREMSTYKTNRIRKKVHGLDFKFSFQLDESSVWRRDGRIDASGEKAILDKLEANLRNSEKLEVYPDTVFKASVRYYQEQLAKGIKEAKPISLTAVNTWWQENSIQGVTANIGLFLANQKMPMTLKINSAAEANGLLVGGMAGTGKSNLLDNIVIELCIRYSPEELNLYLIDMKDGVGMSKYRKMPHVKVLGLESNAEFALGVLKHLKEVSEKRNKLFKETGVDNFTDYRNKTGEILPRILLIIDEFSLLFKDNDHAEQGIAAIINQMRAQGIHLILAAQQLKTFTFVPEKLLKAVPQRIVLRVSDIAESNNFLSLNNDAAAKIAPSQVGQAIFNNSSGDVSGNQFFQSTFVDDQSFTDALKKLSSSPKYIKNNPYIYENYLYSKWSTRAFKTIKRKTALIGDTMQYGRFGQLVFSEDIPSNILLTHNDKETMKNITLNLLYSFLYTDCRVYYLNLNEETDVTNSVRRFSKVELTNFRVVGKAKSNVFIEELLGKVNDFQRTNKGFTKPTFLIISSLEKIRIGSETLNTIKELLEIASEYNLFLIINTQSLTSALKRMDIPYNFGTYFSQIIASDLNEINVPKIADNEKQTLIYDTLHEVANKVRIFDALPLSNQGEKNDQCDY